MSAYSQSFPILSVVVRADSSAPSFDPTSAVRFDLDRGQIVLSDDEPQLLVPASVLVSLATGAMAARDVGRVLGGTLLARISARLERSAAGALGESDTLSRFRDASLETVVEWLGCELALTGLGSLAVERWGRALVLVLEPCAIDARADELLEGLVEAALGNLCDADLGAIVVDRSENHARVLVVHAALRERVAEMREAGAGLVDIVQALHGAGSKNGELIRGGAAGSSSLAPENAG